MSSLRMMPVETQSRRRSSNASRVARAADFIGLEPGRNKLKPSTRLARISAVLILPRTTRHRTRTLAFEPLRLKLFRARDTWFVRGGDTGHSVRREFSYIF